MGREPSNSVLWNKSNSKLGRGRLPTRGEKILRVETSPFLFGIGEGGGRNKEK